MPRYRVQIFILVVCAATAVLICHQTQHVSAANQSESAPTFYRDVLPILQQHCQSCHRPGEIGPLTLMTYEEARTEARSIAFITANRKMPPWFADPAIGHFANDPSLSPQEISILDAWSKAKAPAGDPHDAPPPREWTNGWNIPQPDAIVKMTKPVAASRKRRHRIHLRNRPHELHRSKMDSAFRNSPVKPRERSSRRCLHPATRIESGSSTRRSEFPSPPRT